jgi:hypothetical protein
MTEASMNPYAAHEDASLAHAVTIENPGHQIRATIEITDAYMAESLVRYRYRKSNRLLDGILYAIALYILIVAISSFVMGRWNILSIIMIVSSIVVLFGKFFVKIENYFILRRFRDSPLRNQRLLVTLSDEGYRGQSSVGNVKLGWAAYSHALGFTDGVLMFQGKGLFHWIPFRCLEDKADAPILYGYIQSRIEACKSKVSNSQNRR